MNTPYDKPDNRYDVSVQTNIAELLIVFNLYNLSPYNNNNTPYRAYGAIGDRRFGCPGRPKVVQKSISSEYGTNVSDRSHSVMARQLRLEGA